MCSPTKCLNRVNSLVTIKEKIQISHNIKKKLFRYILTIFWNIVTLPLMIRVAAVGDDASPPAVMTTQLPRLS